MSHPVARTCLYRPVIPILVFALLITQTTRSMKRHWIPYMFSPEGCVCMIVKPSILKGSSKNSCLEFYDTSDRYMGIMTRFYNMIDGGLVVEIAFSLHVRNYIFALSNIFTNVVRLLLATMSTNISRQFLLSWA